MHVKDIPKAMDLRAELRELMELPGPNENVVYTLGFYRPKPDNFKDGEFVTSHAFKIDYEFADAIIKQRLNTITKKLIDLGVTF